jgi:pimeloyl-ACP methyl ester carboxylesterase
VLVVPALDRGSTRSQQLLEAAGVHLLGRDLQAVPGWLGDDNVRGAGRRERAAQLRHVRTQGAPGLGRRLILPHGVDEALGRDALARMDEQHGQQPALAPAPEIEPPLVRRGHERAEDPQLQLHGPGFPPVWGGRNRNATSLWDHPRAEATGGVGLSTIDDEIVLRTASRDGTEIGYFKTGEGPPLVLVHGLLGDHTRWTALRPHFEPHCTVYALDRRGRGASGDHPDYDVVREHEDVAAVVDTIADTVGDGVAVLGSSGGASYALAAAGLTPNIRRLVLFEPPARPVLELLPAELLDRLDAMLAAGEREALLETAYRAVVGLSEAEIDYLRRRPEWPNRVAAAHTVPRELRVSPERAFDPEQAATVGTPTLVLVGGATPEPFRASAQTVAATLPNARLTVLAGQHHGAEMFAPDIVADAVLAFLRNGQ